MARSLTLSLAALLALFGCDSGGGGADPAADMGAAGAGGGGVEVDVEGLEAITIAPQSAQLQVGSIKQFTAVGTFPGGETRDVTEAAEWLSSDPSVLTISNEPGSKGLATMLRDAPVTITATVGAIASERVFDKRCDYPEFQGGVVLGQVVPPVSWEFGYLGNGTTVERIPFSLEDIFCKAEWAHVQTIVVVFGAGWCGACSAFAQRLNADAATLERTGSLAMYLEFEDENYEPADTEWANRHLTRLIGNGPGLRLGDADTLPQGSLFNNSGIIRGGLPVIAVIRTSDMRIIYDSNGVEGPVRLVDVLEAPQEDWTMGDPDMFQSNCNNDEASEPNNTLEQAALLEPGSVRGGICDEHPDYYRIEHEGPWDLTLNFSHVTGDLDVYVWDVAEDKPMLDGEGQPVGSATLDDNEQFQWQGPAIIQVIGHDYSSAEYLLTLRPL